MQNASASTGVSSFESDVNLANPATVCGQAFTEFANDGGECDLTVPHSVRADFFCRCLGQCLSGCDVQAQRFGNLSNCGGWVFGLHGGSDVMYLTSTRGVIDYLGGVQC